MVVQARRAALLHESFKNSGCSRLVTLLCLWGWFSTEWSQLGCCHVFVPAHGNGEREEKSWARGLSLNKDDFRIVHATSAHTPLV